MTDTIVGPVNGHRIVNLLKPVPVPDQALSRPREEVPPSSRRSTARTIRSPTG
ncbi:hypothetical protein WKI68_36905 [Streptomyces sp. MS1.HAVA.3]|uniref:Uncharacterized protein n=1 Tax=Streptomyces caledonius TaxID=3134107 RepID=A0ABU8UD94_9ACTN